MIQTNTKQIILIIGFLLYTLINGFSQSPAAYQVTRNAKKSIKIAQAFINQGKFNQAKKQLEYTIQLKDNFAVAYRELGRVCLELKHYQNAIDAYEQSFLYDSHLSRAAYFECGAAYLMLENTNQALFYFNEYEHKETEKFTNSKREINLDKKYKQLLVQKKTNLDFIQNASNQFMDIALTNLGRNINSADHECLPAILSSGQRMVFTRESKKGNQNILTSVKDEHNLWTVSRALDDKVNSYANEGMAKFTTDGRRFYFSGCKRPDTNGGCDIYVAQISIFGEVVSVKHVEGLNTYSWESQACPTCNEDALYFSSNRPGGYGGSDLYVSYKIGDNLWSKPKNLGPDINTEKDEEAPFVATDGKTLYFTSNGLPGFGDSDLFLTKLDDNNEWTNPLNLGAPINTPNKELGFYLKGDGETAYFASARPQGMGGLDIYEFTLPTALKPFSMNHVEGVIVDDLTNEPIVTKFVIRRIGEHYDLKSDTNGAFFTCLKQEKAYTFHLEVEGYKEFMSAIYLPQTDNQQTTKVEIRLIPLPSQNTSPLPTVLEEHHAIAKLPEKIEKRVFFYFDVNSYDLTTQTQSKLDDLMHTIKFDNNWNIEVIGFADSSGDPAYNKVLSEKRANVISDYLQNAGLRIDRVVQEGRGAVYGETATDRKKSRRVEVVLRGLSSHE